MHIRGHRDFQRQPVERFVRSHRRRLGRRAKMQPDFADIPAVKAEINHGNWLARCPFCPGAELVDPEDSRFWCISCDNAGAGHRWLRVDMPRQRAAIEAELLKRSRDGARNWRPGESVAALRRENKANGV